MIENLYCSLRAAGDPDKVVAETPAGERITYDGLDRRAAQVAQALVAMGVGPGGRVAAQVEKSVAGLALYLGVLRAGAVFLPLNPAYTAAEIGYFLNDAEPMLFVCDPARETEFESFGVRTATLDAKGEGTLAAKADAMPDGFATIARTADDLAAILYTSGTTGRSKGAMLTHGNLLSNAQALRDIWRFSRDDVLIHALPIFHVHGLFVATHLVLLSGASMFYLPRFEPGEIFRLMPRATCLMGVPAFYVRLLRDERLTREAVRHMRVFISGSAPLLAETHAAWQARTGHSILERYGMTETSMITSNPYEGERIAGTVGFPLPGVAVRIAEAATGRVLDTGEIGVIEVKGPNVFKGYWRNPQKTAADFRPGGFFITGDLGKIDARGYMHILGRDKDLIITGGFNVYPKEIESEIDAIPGVAESAVIGVPHPDFGEGVTAIVVANGRTALDEARVNAALSTSLAKYKLPKRVIFVDELPRNAMGKVQKNVLRQTYGNLYAEA